MRELTGHVVNPANDRLKVEAIDPPAEPGGASSFYRIAGYIDKDGKPGASYLRFQNGPVAEDGNGVNGITHEALLAILVDRLQCFQAGPYACRENALALTRLEEAQHWLHHRTRARMAKGIEGTHHVG
jgi:hypothetical protein